MIVEGLVTTENPDGSVRVSPMGPTVDEGIARLLFRPYQTSTTFQNLVRTRRGVFHITDDVEMLSRAAIDCWDAQPELVRAEEFDGWILSGACRWFAFEISAIDDRQPRAELTADIVARGWMRDFLGFNRAKNAVVEAAILATRTAFLPPEVIAKQFEHLASAVEKTGGSAELRAFALLADFVRAARTPVPVAGETATSDSLPSPARTTH